MDITAEKYYDDNLENYNLLNKIDPMTAKQAMQMMEGYHQAKLKLLDIADVVGQSEQLKAFVEYCDEEHGLFIPSWMIDGYNKSR
jgi:hypothetical protein